MFATVVLLLILFAFSIGFGAHLAAFFHIYLMLAAAALLPVFIAANFMEEGFTSRAWAVFLDLLGEGNADYGSVFGWTMLAGLLIGFLGRMMRSKART